MRLAMLKRNAEKRKNENIDEIDVDDDNEEDRFFPFHAICMMMRNKTRV